MRSNSTDREVEDEKDEVINTEDTNENQESLYEDVEEELRDVKMQEQSRRSQRIKQPPKYLEDFDINFIAALLAGHLPFEVPRTYKEVINSNDRWKEAINEELKLLEENGTWKIVPQPPNVNVIDSRWVFTKKIDRQ